MICLFAGSCFSRISLNHSFVCCAFISRPCRSKQTISIENKEGIPKLSFFCCWDAIEDKKNNRIKLNAVVHPAPINA